MYKRKSLKYRLLSLFSWLIILFYLANLYRMTDHTPVPYYALMIFLGIWGLYQMFVCKTINWHFFSWMFLLYMITGVLNGTFIGNLSSNDLIKSIFLFGTVISLYAFPIKYYQGLIFFYVVVAYFFYLFFTGALAKDILTSSGNYVSIVLILSVCIYYMGLHNSGRVFRVIDIVPSVVCFLLSIWARGRGGILSTAFLLVLVLLVFIKNSGKSTIFHKVIKFAVVLVILYLLWNINDIIDTFLTLDKFEREGFDTPRPFMWAAYLSKMMESPIYILMGAPLNEISVIHAYENNTHNSFLQLHAFNGIMMFVIFFYCLFKAIVFYIRNDMMALLVITLSLVMRGMTDKFIFGQYGMPIMMFLAFYPFAYAKKLHYGIKLKKNK